MRVAQQMAPTVRACGTGDDVPGPGMHGRALRER
jgi:hypothetical protein